MKALNVLNESKRAICIFIDSFDEESKEDAEYTSSIKYLEEINEAIKELEDLENSTCNWYKDEEDSSDFSSDCGVQFTFNEGMPSENYMKFCCKCGKKLIEHKYDVDTKYKKGKSMTRDTAKEEWSKIIESGIINFNEKNLIDKIYDDFENRSCENCKFKYVVDSMCTECRCSESPIDYIDFDFFPFFSCSEWEPK